MPDEPDEPDEIGGLAGCGVLVTRPRQQAWRLAQLLERHGARALRFALVEIAAPSDPNAAQAALAQLTHTDLVIFVSANAVRFAAQLLPDVAARLHRARIACVGDATAAALHAIGVATDVVPQTASTSEALLAQDELQPAAVRGCEVAIVRGEGGRELLARTLTERGARVALVEAYRRESPREDLGAFLDTHAADIDLAIVTSGDALQRLATLGGMQRVRALPLVLPSDRVLEQAVALGFTGPFTVPRRMSDAELARAAGRLADAIAMGSDATRCDAMGPGAATS